MLDFTQAFSNVTRVKILACLSSKEKSVSELIENCELSQSAISQHLKKLKDAELVTSKVVGKKRIYNLTNQKLGQVAKDLLKMT